MAHEFIPYGHQSISEEDIAAVAAVLRGDWLTCGPDVDAFERAFAQYVGAKHAVSFANGTAALHGAMSAAGVEPGDAVIVPPLTFAATSNSAVYLGGVPVFADISRDTFCMDPADADRAARECGRRVKVFAPVSFAGYPVDIAAFKELARRHGAVVIEDGCHALGAERNGKKVGAEADMTAFSFHPVKHITTGEGGMVTTDSDRYAEHLRAFRAHGITRDPSKFKRSYAGGWDNDMQCLGYNYRLSDIQCALGASQLKRVDHFVARRREIAAMYEERLRDIDGVELPPSCAGHSWHLFAARFPADRRAQIFDRLREAGLGVQVHYIPVYAHSFYREHFPQDAARFPVSEETCARELSLPIFCGMTDEQVDLAVEDVRQALRS